MINLFFKKKKKNRERKKLEKKKGTKRIVKCNRKIKEFNYFFILIY